MYFLNPVCDMRKGSIFLVSNYIFKVRKSDKNYPFFFLIFKKIYLFKELPILIHVFSWLFILV